MNRFSFLAAIAALLCLHSGTAAALTKERSGDVVTFLLPVGAYFTAHTKSDAQGEGQLLRSNGVSLLLNSALRVAFNKTSWGERPNGHPYGFPSGHTAFVVTQAAFLLDRYGWHYGLPAFALAGYVTYVRIDTGHHRWRDVIAGAALSIGVSKLAVTPDYATHLAPIIGPDFLGLRWERSF